MGFALNHSEGLRQDESVDGPGSEVDRLEVTPAVTADFIATDPPGPGRHRIHPVLDLVSAVVSEKFVISDLPRRRTTTLQLIQIEADVSVTEGDHRESGGDQHTRGVHDGNRIRQQSLKT